MDSRCPNSAPPQMDGTTGLRRPRGDMMSDNSEEKEVATLDHHSSEAQHHVNESTETKMKKRKSADTTSSTVAPPERIDVNVGRSNPVKAKISAVVATASVSTRLTSLSTSTGVLAQHQRNTDAMTIHFPKEQESNRSCPLVQHSPPTQTQEMVIAEERLVNAPIGVSPWTKILTDDAVNPVTELRTRFQNGFETANDSLTFFQDLIHGIEVAKQKGDKSMQRDLYRLRGFRARSKDQLVMFHTTLKTQRLEHRRNGGNLNSWGFGSIQVTIRDMIEAMDEEALLENVPQRLLSVTFCISDQELVSPFDVNRLRDRILELFGWYRSEQTRKMYMAPYFPVIQSSGMGKTKLLYEVAKCFNSADMRDYTSVLVLFTDGAADIPAADNGVFPEGNRIELQIDRMSTVEEMAQMKGRLLATLDHLLQQCEGVSKIVFLFDEVQPLLETKGYMFRVILWWLKLQRHRKEVVALFAGSSCQIADYYIEPLPEPASSRVSIPTYFASGNTSYPPFFDICTIGCYVDRPLNENYDNPSMTTEYTKAICHGRPLFVLMQHHGKLDEDAYFNILHNMLLPGERTWWYESKYSCFSILATRVQMGQTKVALTSKLVQYGYAGLTRFKGSPQDEKEVNMCHFPDPVCARLAMCMMDEEWSLEKKGSSEASWSGKDKDFWVSKMKEIYSTGLCKRPKGGTAKIFVALYMLFCGDVIRKQYNDAYHTFSIPLDFWVHALLGYSEDSGLLAKGAIPKAISVDALACKHAPRISFIQVCENYLHYALDGLCQQKVLEDMYNGGTAYYAYSYSHCFDMVGSIRLTDSSDCKTYAPLLISVKAMTDRFGAVEAKKHLDDMVQEVTGAGQKTALCLLVVVGCTARPEYDDVHLRTRMRALTDRILPMILYIKNDMLNTPEVSEKVDLVDQEMAEIYASHRLLYSYAKTDGLDQGALRPRTGENSEASEYIKKFRNCLTPEKDERLETEQGNIDP